MHASQIMVRTAKLFGFIPLSSLASSHDFLDVHAKSFKTRKTIMQIFWDRPIIIPSIQLRTQLQGRRPRHPHYCCQQRVFVPPPAGLSAKKLLPTNEDLYLDA